MRPAGANCAPAGMEDTESVGERDLQVLFLAFFGDPPCIEQDAAKRLAILDCAFFDHLDNFGKFHESEFDVFVVLRVSVSGHETFR